MREMKSPLFTRVLILIVLSSLLLSACASQPVEAQTERLAAIQSDGTLAITLETNIIDGRMVFVGVGGEIDGIVNPNLEAQPGDTIELTLQNADGAQHDFAVPDLEVASEKITGKGSQTELTFKVSETGTFTYICTLPGHQQMGMEGQLRVGGEAAQVETPVSQAANIAYDPANIPDGVGSRGPEEIDLLLETIEVEGQLADGTTYTYWTFDGTVPGPFLRIRVGDRVNVTLRNAANSTQPHSVDFHAVTGPGGGAAVTQTMPGEETSFSFTALNPGLYVYHCATPMVAHHIANGMYGLILVEPEGGLPAVDREFYVMQGEIYSDLDHGQKGHAEADVTKLLDEAPEYYVFNGSTTALTADFPMQAAVGETVRIYFGVGGPNAISSFHVIGEIFDRVFDQGALTSAPLTDVQTVLVPAGGASMVEFKLEVPGRYILVDHALSRLERGLVGFLMVDGDDNPDIFDGTVDPNSGH
jgi:nitrite reductase (NO-forming)